MRKKKDKNKGKNEELYQEIEGGKKGRNQEERKKL